MSVVFTPSGGVPGPIPVPAGVMYDLGFPTAGGQPEILNFSWSPSSAVNGIGLYEFSYSLLDSNGLVADCTVAINVFECVMLVGTQPIVSQLGSDPGDLLRVNPLIIRPMTLSTLATFPIPDIAALVGFKIYFQGGVYNEAAYPTNPLSLSWGIEYTIGVGAAYYGTGPLQNINIHPLGDGVVNPGDTLVIPFTLAGF